MSPSSATITSSLLYILIHSDFCGDYSGLFRTSGYPTQCPTLDSIPLFSAEVPGWDTSGRRISLATRCQARKAQVALQTHTDPIIMSWRPPWGRPRCSLWLCMMLTRLYTWGTATPAASSHRTYTLDLAVRADGPDRNIPSVSLPLPLTTIPPYSKDGDDLVAPLARRHCNGIQTP